MKLYLNLEQAEIVRDALYSKKGPIQHKEGDGPNEKTEAEVQEVERLIEWLGKEIDKEKNY